MAKEQTEDELNLRRKARRRLIGTIALTLAVVVILPMVLDSEPKPAGQDIDLRIPASDNAGKFVPGVAASEVAGMPPFAASAVAIAPASPDATVVKKNDTASQIVAPSKAQPASKPSKIHTPVSGSATKPGATKLASGDGFVVQVGAYSNAGAAKQELNKLKKWGFKAYTEKAGEKVRVRVGPYAERAKAEKVRQLLEKRGLNPVVMSVK